MKKIELDEDRLRHLVEVEQLTQVQIAELFGCDRVTIQRRCYSLGLKTQKTGPRSGDKHTGWKGGRRLVGGYWYIYYPDHPFATKNKTVAEHRLVVEENLKRYLLPSEVVHHRNGNPQDNRIENLEVFSSNSEHLKHELTGRIPNWSPEGLAKMEEGTRKRRIQLLTAKRDAQGRLLSNVHQPSTT
jgi:hypothetical protein